MNRILPFAVVPFMLVALSACGLKDISRQIDTVDNVGVIKGKVDVKSPQKGPVVVLRFQVSDKVFTLENQVIASGTGNYEFTVEPGEYLVAAFIDVNQDGRFQRGQEHGNFSTDPLTFTVGERETVELETIVIRGDPPVLADDQRVIIAQSEINKSIGKVVSLDDPMFKRDNYAMGMWRPLDFLNSVGGGLLFLQDYDASKVPVVFVHGIAGGPTDLRKLIESLDGERFQPWVLYYPSGVRLDMVSDYMVKAVTDLQNEYGFERFDVVAHSMGGLVTRSFVKKYVERFPQRERQIGFVMTINSPMGGMESASSGVDLSPVVVPAWRDVATGSEFLGDLHDWTWPGQIPYYLVFSHEAESGDDGVVTLESQIPFKLQSEAVRIYGFTNNHVGTLSDEAFISLFRSITRVTAQ
jgi:pimeloyl-ACP methyl ester carboxylesterase